MPSQSNANTTLSRSLRSVWLPRTKARRNVRGVVSALLLSVRANCRMCASLFAMASHAELWSVNFERIREMLVSSSTWPGKRAMVLVKEFSLSSVRNCL